MALAQRVSVARPRATLLGLGRDRGACLFFGDGVITPAISVLSAVEGLEIATPAPERYVSTSAVVIVGIVRRAMAGHGHRRAGVWSGHGWSGSSCSRCRDREIVDHP